MHNACPCNRHYYFKEIFMNFIKMTRQVESYRHLGENRIVIRRTKSGGAGCYLTVAVRENKKYVTTEINYESK
ncbi:acetylxylan esterase [Escherichia coli]|nr:acetylxylan esterase [Escherichia coli]